VSEIKLLPCPFCGGEAKFGTFNHFWIECTNCEMETPYMENEEELVALWNTRKPIDDMVERLERKRLESTECKAEAIAEMCGSSASRFGGEIYAYNKAIDIVRGGRE